MGKKAVSIDKKKGIVLLRDTGMCQHEISRKLNVYRTCVRQTIRKFNELHTTATKPVAERPFKMTRRQKRAIKLQQLRDDTLSLNDLVRYAQASLNLNISRQTVSRILREFDLVSYVAPRKPQITHEQRRCRIFWCYKHLSWTETDWSNVIFSDEANFEIVNRNNRIYIRRFRNDLKRHERFQPRVHRGGGLGIWSYITYNDLGPLVFFNGRLNSDKYIEILENNLPNVFENFSSEQSKKNLYQQDNARPHTSAKTSKYFKKKHIKLIPWSARSPDLNIIENIWSIVDQKLLKCSISNMGQLEEALKTVWAEISKDVTRKLFQSIPTRLRQVINNKGYACCY
ncbi:unnamed protein product [Rotaria magnacalcarata]